ncbi:hypothetical protein NQ314_016018 [Rhamnusium bicolor]|uniref:Uncharacterized protein n=1 Tax=Rhamnusium bicolor TaxID=1586634 RepID=A0AAV8WXY4_9CUCU|nr:hypothetical protein NQ314_016018 [Rhamnusium bicolor]
MTEIFYGKTQLKNNAVPSIFQFPKHLLKTVKARRRLIRTDQQDEISGVINATELPRESLPVPENEPKENSPVEG